MVTWLCLKSLRTSGVYREPRSGSRYNVRISKWLLQSHVTILKQTLCKCSRKLCGSDFNRLNNQNKNFLLIEEKENHFRRQLAHFFQSTVGSKQFFNFVVPWFFCLISKRANCPWKKRTDDDSILAKITCDKIRWLDNLWKRWIQVKKKEDPEFFGTSMDMIFAESLDLANQYLCQFIQGIFSVSPSTRNFFRLCKPPLPNPHPSVVSSSCKSVTAQLTLHKEKSKIKILLGDRIVCNNKQWQKTDNTFSRKSNN